MNVGIDYVPPKVWAWESGLSWGTETPMMSTNRAGPELGFSREPASAVDAQFLNFEAGSRRSRERSPGAVSATQSGQGA